MNPADGPGSAMPPDDHYPGGGAEGHGGTAAGITALQGFLHLPPVPLAEFTAWLAQNRRNMDDELAPT